MYFSILTKVKNGLSTSWKIGVFLVKMLILNPSFQREGQFYASFLFYVLII